MNISNVFLSFFQDLSALFRHPGALFFLLLLLHLYGFRLFFRFQILLIHRVRNDQTGFFLIQMPLQKHSFLNHQFQILTNLSFCLSGLIGQFFDIAVCPVSDLLYVLAESLHSATDHSSSDSHSETCRCNASHGGGCND